MEPENLISSEPSKRRRDVFPIPFFPTMCVTFPACTLTVNGSNKARSSKTIERFSHAKMRELSEFKTIVLFFGSASKPR